MTVPLAHALGVAGVLFALGLLGVLMRRNLLFVLLSLEVMLNAGGFAFVAAGARHRAPDGQSMVFFILAVAAAELAVGLALVLALFRNTRTIDADRARWLGG
jgi:NADH-quinone oxidoreductase subunit K